MYLWAPPARRDAAGLGKIMRKHSNDRKLAMRFMWFEHTASWSETRLLDPGSNGAAMASGNGGGVKNGASTHRGYREYMADILVAVLIFRESLWTPLLPPASRWLYLWPLPAPRDQSEWIDPEN